MATAVGFPGKEVDASNLENITTGGKCLRCGGLMVVEPCSGFWDNGQSPAGGRCVQCGKVIDAVILRNRRRRAGAISSPQSAQL